MDALEVSEIFMNIDSKDSDLDDSFSDFDDDLDLTTSDSETDSDDDEALQAASPSLVSTSQATAAKQQYSWHPAGRHPPVTAFMGMQGPTSEVVVTDTESPLQYFQLIFGDVLMDLLIEETNRYASQYLA